MLDRHNKIAISKNNCSTTNARCTTLHPDALWLLKTPLKTPTSKHYLSPKKQELPMLRGALVIDKNGKQDTASLNRIVPMFLTDEETFNLNTLTYASYYTKEFKSDLG